MLNDTCVREGEDLIYLFLDDLKPQTNSPSLLRMYFFCVFCGEGRLCGDIA